MVVFDYIARRWRRLVAVALAAGLVVAAIVVVRVVGHARDRVALIAAIERESGFRVRGVGDLEPAFWPSPGLLARNVSIQPSGMVRAAEIDALTVHLDLPQLLLGRLRVSAVTLASAHLTIDPSRPASARLGAALGRGERRLDTLRLRDVMLSFADAPDAIAPINILRGELHWRDPDAPVSFAGQGVWRDVPAEAAFWVQRPVDLLAGRPSAVLARILSQPLSVEAQGEYVEGLGFRGHVDAHSASLRGLEDLGLLDAPQLRRVGRASVKAEAALTHRGLSFANAVILLDDNAFEGSFSLRHDDGRPSLAATLASPDLDVSGWAAAAPALIERADGGRAPNWSRDLLDWRQESAADLDLRISVRRLRLPPYEASDVALAVLMKSGRMELTVSEAAGYGGGARGRLRVTPTAAGVEAKGLLTLNDVDLGLLPMRAAARRRLRGVVSGQLSFDAHGDTPRALAANVDGRLAAQLRNGEIAGLDLEHVVLRPERRFPIIVRASAARTSFDDASITARAVAGAVIFDELRLRGPGVDATARGGLDLPSLTGSVRVEAKAAGAAAATAPSAFYLGGSIFDPRVLPDPLAAPDGAEPPIGFPPWAPR